MSSFIRKMYCFFKFNSTCPINNLKIKPDNVYNSVLHLTQAAGAFYYTPTMAKIVMSRKYI